MSLSRRSRVNWKVGAPQLKAKMPEPSGATSGTPTAEMSLSHSPIELVKPRVATSFSDFSMFALSFGQFFGSSPLDVAEQPFALLGGRGHDQRAADGGGGERQTRALQQAQHRAVLERARSR